MFKKLTKNNKQIVLDNEINEVLEVMKNVLPQDYEDNATNLDKEIETVLVEMSNVDERDSDEYKNMVDILDKLYKAKSNEKSRMSMYSELSETLERLYKMKETKTVPNQFPWREIVVGAFAVAQILIIINYEDVNVITTKALGFVSKGRV